MRNLTFAKMSIQLGELEYVLEDFKFVESKAKQNAKTNDEVKEFYLEGVKAIGMFPAIFTRELKEIT